MPEIMWQNRRQAWLVAEDVKFEVKDTREIQKVVMKDEAEPDKPDQPKETPKPWVK